MDKETLERAKFLDMLINRYSKQITDIEGQICNNKHNLSVRITAGLNDNDCNVYVPDVLQDDIIDKTIKYFDKEIIKAADELEKL